jgi:opacity protein-like surface antigen
MAAHCGLPFAGPRHHIQYSPRDGELCEGENMKTIQKLILAALVTVPFVASAVAADVETPMPQVEPVASGFGMYVRGDVGASLLRWSGGNDDEAMAIGGGVGFKASDFFRTDLTVDYNGNYNVGGGKKISSVAVMGNGYLDWANDTMFTPYVGLGVGYNWVKNNPNGVALGAMAGVAVDLNENLAIDVGYKFRDTMAKGPDLKEHILSAGMRFKF